MLHPWQHLITELLAKATPTAVQKRYSPAVPSVFSLLSKYIFYIYIVLYLTFVGGKSLKSDGWLWYENKKRYHIRSSKDRYIY